MTDTLDTIDSAGETVAIFTTDELTSHCPFDFGGPDFYNLTIRYEPDGKGVESRSLKEYLQSFRNDETTAEALATQIHADVVSAINPERCYVHLEQARRGGLEETVEVGDLSLRD